MSTWWVLIRINAHYEMEHKILTEIARIAEKVVSSSDIEAPLILLELKDIYQQCPHTSLKILKVHVWHYGLVHILIELLGQNFTAVGGQWTTAVELATILSHSLTGLQPEKLKKAIQLDASQIKEYYDDVLPTALHSLLVLTNNLLTISAPMLSDMLENLSKLCQSHHTLMVSLMQSPYLLHMLASASEDSSLNLMLSFIKRILSESPNLSMLPIEVVHNYMDELVHKITTCSNPILALEVFSIFLESPNIAESVANRYPGLKKFLYSFQVESQAVNIEWILEKLGDDFNHAATVIQSYWKGYCARKKVKAIHRGVVAFQRLYRKVKAKKTKEERRRDDLMANDLKQENQHIALRTFHEKQFKIIEQLPAKEVDSFLDHLQKISATKIQRWWRMKKNQPARKKPSDYRQQTTNTANMATNSTTTTHGKESVLLFTDDNTRNKLQEEIANYQKQHPITHRSPASLQQLHSEVQHQLQIMYLDRTLEKERNRKRNLLLNQLEVDSALLLSAPSLEKAQPSNITHFTGGAHGIVYMAQMAHEEELKSLKLPWWKRTNFDNDELDLDD